MLDLGLGITGIAVRGGSAYADPAYSLVMDFRTAQYYRNGTSYTLSAMPGYASTRSGAVSFVNSIGTVDNFAANVPPVLSAIGYEAYGALTNYVRDSNNISGLGWTAANITATLNTLAAPDATTTADTATAIAGTAVTEMLSSQSGPFAATTFTSSRFVKMGTQRYVWLGDRGDSLIHSATFDLQAGTLVGNSNGTGYIVSCGNGWYRLVLVYTRADATGTIGQNIALTGAAHVTDRVAFAAAGTETFYNWGTNVVDGTFPDGGPIIATAGATASIGASDLHVTDSPADVTQLIWATANMRAYGSANQRLAHISDGTAANMVELYFAGTVPTAKVTTASVAAFNQTGAAAATGQIALVLLRSGANWRAGKIVAGVLTWFGIATAGTFPTLSRIDAGANAGADLADDEVRGVFRKTITDTSDANIIATVGTI